MEQTASWKSVVEDECVFTDGKPIPFLLLRNKVDMVEDEEKKKEFEEETKNFCDENEFVKSFLTSAKENINVNESMSFLLDHIIQRLNDYLKQGNEDKNNIEYFSCNKYNNPISEQAIKTSSLNLPIELKVCPFPVLSKALIYGCGFSTLKLIVQINPLYVPQANWITSFLAS